MQKTGSAVATADTPKSAKSARTSKLTPKLSTPRKKSSSQKALMGHKWFKGSPKSRGSNQRMSKKLLKSSPIEKTSEPVIPPQIVEFDLGGTPDRLSVFDPIHILEQNTEEVLNISGTLCNFDIKQETPLPTVTGSKKGKGSVKSGKTRVKSTGKQKNGKTPNTTKTPDVEGRKKSWSYMNKLPEASYRIIADYVEIEAPPKPNAYIRYMERPHEELADEVEYDLDEEDCAWLDLVNDKRKEQNFLPVNFNDMELLMDRLEKESYFQMQSTGIDQGALIDDDAVCCICMDGECQNSNAILFCDMCNLAVHQECYGVPYIPEGQWLCRRCLQSPSRAVDCALCPNKGGAFKQTDDGRWAHVVCAIWIPEVCFANTVFLEPVDSIGNIPPARWRLVCYICKQKGVGACIQCHKGNCYTAFHVTCAQQAGLCMKMDTVKESSSITIKKTAFCDHHAPPESDFFKDGDGTPSPRQKMRKTRKLLAEKRSAIPVLSIPTIPHDRIAEITSTVNFSRKNQFIKRLMAYWKLKRQLRNGVPLLRRLQAASSLPHPTRRDTPGSVDPNQVAENQEHYRYWLRLRQDLERARLLCELVRKREKVKRELIHLKSREVEIKLKPFSLLLLNVLEEIQSKDIQQIFANPVDISEVPDYLDVVEKPMDFSTIKEKISSFEYNNIEEFEADFNLMIDNCLNYNSKDTVFYRTGVRLREIGGIIIRYARRSINSIGFDPATGLHLPERTHVPVVLTDEEILQKVENLLNDEKRFEMPFDKHLELLHEVLDDALALSHSATRKKKFSRVKQEIVRVRRLKHSKNSQLNKLSSKSPIKRKYNRTRSHTSHSDRDSSPEVSNLRARSKKLSSEKQAPGQSSTEKSTKRTLRPVKRKLSDATTVSEQSRSSANKLTTMTVANTVKPPAKKSRRMSSSASTSTTTSTSLTAPVMSTPPKSRGHQTSTSPEWKKTLSFSPDSSSSKTSSTLRDRDAIRLRDREPHNEKPKTQQQQKKALSKSPTQPSGVNRRSAILFTKKGNSTPAKNQPSSPTKNRDSRSPSKNSQLPNVLSPSQPKTNNLNSKKPTAGRKARVSAKSVDTPPLPATTKNSNKGKKGVKNPPSRRNSTRTKVTKNATTINNNVMKDNNSHRSNNSLLCNTNMNSPYGANESPVSSSSHSKTISGKAYPVSNTNLMNSNTASTTNTNSRRKKKNSKNNTLTSSLNVTNNNNNNNGIQSNFVGENNISGSLSTSIGGNGNGNMLNNFQPWSRMSVLNSSNNNNSKNSKGDNTKSDSFMVYRSGGRDMDSNSEDEDEQSGNKEQDEVPGGSDDSDSDDDQESADGSQSSTDDNSSGCSNTKNAMSKSSSSESEESADSDSDNRVVARLNSHQTKNDHHSVVNAVNRKKVNHNQSNQCRHQNSNADEDEEEEGLVHDDVNLTKVRLQPLDLVWAKCKDGFWYPALIVNPDIPQGFTQNQVHIPGPPSEILVKRPRAPNEACFLVLCFDAKRTWEWITRNNLEPLGQNPHIDKGHLDTVRKADRRSDKRALRKAYEKAILHRHRVTEANNDESSRKFHSIQNVSGLIQDLPGPNLDSMESMESISALSDSNDNLDASEFSSSNEEESVLHKSVTVDSSHRSHRFLLRSAKCRPPLVSEETLSVPKQIKNEAVKGKRIYSSESSTSPLISQVSQVEKSRRTSSRMVSYVGMIKKCRCCE